MPYETIDTDNIHEMVRSFYTTILGDDMLSGTFTKALGDDLNNGKWHEHFHTLDDFWILMMIGKKGYNGDPFPPHAFLGQLSTEMFERWLKLFDETVNKFFVPGIAEKFNKKAEILAAQFIDNLGLNDEEDED